MGLSKISLRNNPIILLSTATFFLGVLIGLYGYLTLTRVEYLEPCCEHSGDLDLVSVLSNNILLITQLIIGSATFGVFTFNLLIRNGAIFGILFANSTESSSIVNVLVLVLPHGIFEIPAIIIAGAAGFKIPYEILRYLLGRKEQVLTRKDIKEYLTLAAVSIVLIIIAAWIEANITLKIAKAMLNPTKGI